MAPWPRLGSWKKENIKIPINSASVQKSELKALLPQMNGDWVDFQQKKPTDGPMEHGFDYSFIFWPASLEYGANIAIWKMSLINGIA